MATFVVKGSLGLYKVFSFIFNRVFPIKVINVKRIIGL